MKPSERTVTFLVIRIKSFLVKILMFHITRTEDEMKQDNEICICWRYIIVAQHSVKPESVSVRDLIIILTQTCCVPCFEFQCSLMLSLCSACCSSLHVEVEAGFHLCTKEIFARNVQHFNSSRVKFNVTAVRAVISKVLLDINSNVGTIDLVDQWVKHMRTPQQSTRACTQPCWCNV